MLLRRSALLFVLLAPLASADVQFTSPAAGAKAAGGSALTVEWKDSGSAPSISDLKGYQLFVCAGSNTNTAPTCASLEDQGVFSGGNKASAPIPVGFGASTPPNAYFLKMVSTAGAGGTVINFSDRFSLSGMTGTFPPTLEADLKNVKDTKGPPSVNQVAGAKGAAGGAEGDFAVPYTMQTGAQRFAPMQPPAPTKITAKDAKPLWPVSASTVATTWLPPPTIATTITQSPNHSVKSRVNTAAPAAQPSDDMAKFLARWKD